jgi:beta-glucosidase/6-phospho-beta-glucosidase/beta-galactosidase
MGGFESASHINKAGHRLDMLNATQHDRFVAEDFAALCSLHIRTVRDSVRWHLVESIPYRYDFTSLDPYIDAANHAGIEVIWDLFHYGWPDGLDIYSVEFVERFAGFCSAVASRIRARVTGVHFYTPLNEISFFAWAAGAAAWFYPFDTSRAGELKRQLVRAWVAAVDAIRTVDPDARIVAVEPLVHAVSPHGVADVDGRVAAQNESQWEALEMIVGRVQPELGGGPRYLDILGVNLYHDHQWEVSSGESLAWHVQPRDSRWLPFHQLVLSAYERYRRPIIISETSHVGDGRAEWIREVTGEMILAMHAGVPLEGICLYPIMDRFEWTDGNHWHNSGLWDYAIAPDGTMRRVLNRPYAAEFLRSQARMAEFGSGSANCCCSSNDGDL